MPAEKKRSSIDHSPLDHVYDRNNVFVKIVEGEIPAHRIYEDEDVLVFMDAFPQTRGHALVIAKRVEAVNLLDVDPQTLTKIMLTVRRIAHAIKTALSPSGIRLMQFNGAAAGQTVFHLHFHLIPVYDEEKISAHAEESGDPASLAILAGQIGAALAKLPADL